MWEVKTESIRIDSASPGLQVQGWLMSCPEAGAKAILQISHGMCEYSGRYLDFAAFMARNGYAVCMHDHLGHGKTSDLPGGVDGYFGPGRSGAYLLKDMHTMSGKAREAWPGLPLILLGHSMGSFFARWYAECWPEEVDALLLSGTGGAPAALEGGLALTAMISKLKGPTARSELVRKMAFGPYQKKIEDPTCASDWISRDHEMVARYAKDPKCTFVFTASAFHEMFWVLRQVNRKDWYHKVPQELPILLLSGDMDPVGNYGKDIRDIRDKLEKTGHQRLEMKLYPGGRHEMLNEINRDEVYEDILDWCGRVLPRQPE